MDGIQVLALTDNDEGEKIVEGFAELGTAVERLTRVEELKRVKSSPDTYAVILVLHLDNMKVAEVLKSLTSYPHSHPWLKFVFVKRSQLRKVDAENYNLSNLEFMLRPVRLEEFFLLVEKSVVAERLKDYLARNIGERDQDHGTYEQLFQILRKNLFSAQEASESVFEKIIKLQGNLDGETLRLQKSLEKLSKRQKRSFVSDKQQVSETLLESLLPSKTSEARHHLLGKEELQEANVDMEEALIAAQERILELQEELARYKQDDRSS